MYNRHIILTIILVCLALGCSKTDLKTKLQGDWVGKSPNGSDITISFEDSIIAGFPWWLDDAKYWIKKDTLYLKYLTRIGQQYRDTTYKIQIIKIDKDSLIFVNAGPSFPMYEFTYRLVRLQPKYDSSISVEKVCYLFSGGMSLKTKYIEISNQGEYLTLYNNSVNTGVIPEQVFMYMQGKIRKCNLKVLDKYYSIPTTCTGTNALTVIFNNGTRKTIYMHDEKPQELDIVQNTLMGLDKYALTVNNKIVNDLSFRDTFQMYINRSFPEYNNLSMGVPIERPITLKKPTLKFK